MSRAALIALGVNSNQGACPCPIKIGPGGPLKTEEVKKQLSWVTS